MSRTYRHRHLPVIAGSSRKYVEHYSRWRREEKAYDEIWRIVAHELLQLPCIDHGKKRWGYQHLHQNCVPWTDRHAHTLVDRLEEDMIWPVGTKGGHPWVNWCHICSAHKSVKKWYRQQAYRRMRRRTRQLLTTYFNRDPDSILMPLRNEYIDWWDVY